MDTKYLREKNVAAILETIAAEIVVQKPNDPEAFLRDRFSEAKEDVFRAEDNVVLFTSQLCPASEVALIVLSFVKTTIPCNVNIVELPDAGGPYPTEFTAASPFGRVPALSHNGLGVVEVGPVVRYLCGRSSACNGSGGAAGTARQRGKVDAAFETIMQNVFVESVTAVNERVFAPKKHQRPADSISVQAAATKFRSALSQLQNAPAFFSESQWVVGSSPTIADFALAAAVFSMHNVAGFDCVTGLEKIGKWWAAAQQETWFAEGLRTSLAAAAKLYAR